MVAPDFQIELVSKLDFNAKCISLKAHVLPSLHPVIVDLLESLIEQSLIVPSNISFMSQYKQDINNRSSVPFIAKPSVNLISVLNP